MQCITASAKRGLVAALLTGAGMLGPTVQGCEAHDILMSHWDGRLQLQLCQSGSSCTLASRAPRNHVHDEIEVV